MKFIPKVGKECQTDIGKGVVKVESDKYGICCVEILGELKLIHCDSLHAIKSPAEIERDAVIQEALNYFDGMIVSINSVKPQAVAEKLYNAGMLHKQQVKPLSFIMLDEIASSNLHNTGLYTALKPYTIQGGDK